MLQKIREKSQGPILTIIVVSVCLMFAATGIDSILGSRKAGSVAKVNGEKVTEQELNEAIFLKKRQLIAQMGENIDASMLDDKKLKEPALQDLVKHKLLLQIADENKMLIADSEINRMIAQNSDFQKDGKFSNDVFQRVLGNAGLTPSLYKRLFTTDVLLQQITSGIVETGFVTDKDIAIDTRFTHQTRDIRYITLKLENEKSSISVSSEDVKAYYEAHPEQFQSDESAIVEYIEINQANFKAEISEAEVKEVYQQEVANFKSEEQREVSHILIELDADTSKEKAVALLTDIKKKIADGQDFSELARTYSDDLGSKDSGGLLGTLNDEAFPKEFVSAAKNLAVDQVSDIVQTESGLHLIKLDSVVTPTLPTFDERKDAITADLQAAKAAPMYMEAVEQLRDLAFNSADLSEPAAALNTEVKTSSTVTRKGGAGLFAKKAVYNAIFSEGVLNNAENSDVIELSPTQVVVVHLKEHHPAALIGYAEVEARARDLVMAEKAREQLASKAEAVRQEVFAGADIETLAHKNNYAWQVALASQRTNPQADPEIINAAFKLPRASGTQLAVDKIQKSNGDYVVLAVSNVQDGKTSDTNAMESGTIKSFVARAAAIEEFDALEAGLKAKADIDIY